MLKKFKRAVKQRDKQLAAFKLLTAGSSDETVTLWTCAVEAWENDPTAENPFASTDQGTQIYSCNVRSVNRCTQL